MDLSNSNMQGMIVSCCGCFHGRTLGVISMSCDNEATRGFGPLLPGHLKVDFDDEAALEKIFKGPKYEIFITYASVIFKLYNCIAVLKILRTLNGWLCC